MINFKGIKKHKILLVDIGTPLILDTKIVNSEPSKA